MCPADPAAPEQPGSRSPFTAPVSEAGSGSAGPEAPSAAAERRGTGGSQPRAGRPRRRQCRCPRAAAPSGTSGRSSRSARRPAPPAWPSRWPPARAGPASARAEPQLRLRRRQRPVRPGLEDPLPAITRKTDKGLPRYNDDPDPDTFILTGAEDLVPVRDGRDGAWEQAPVPPGRRRPRLPGPALPAAGRGPVLADRALARPGHRRDALAHDHLAPTSPRSTARPPASRIADPADPAHVFSWLICETYDDTGNAAVYDYVGRGQLGVDTALAERAQPHRAVPVGEPVPQADPLR